MKVRVMSRSRAVLVNPGRVQVTLSLSGIGPDGKVFTTVSINQEMKCPKVTR